MESDRKCSCKGIRFCAHCKDPHFRKTIQDLLPLHPDVMLQDSQVQSLYLCQECRRMSWSIAPSPSECSDHFAIDDFDGLYLIRDFISEDQERELVAQLETQPWVTSQSGRKKQDYGPKVNFKKEKVKTSSFKGMPAFIKPIMERIKSIEQPQIAKTMEGFQPVELNVLEYEEQRESHIAAHIDDVWLWGKRIIGLNLLSDTRMTFSKEGREIEVPIPRRALYLLSGKSRFEWLHGIKSKHISGKRMVCAIRELSDQFVASNPDSSEKLLEIASTFY